jgi:predicted nucleic acid-binding protein
LIPTLLLDTGPLVAFLDRREALHHWSRRVFQRVRAPLLTCDAVLTEACFLLRHQREGSEAVVRLVERGFVKSAFSLENEAEGVRRLVARYSSIPISFADACLVRMSELHEAAILLTFDTDFTVYRRHGRGEIPLLMPESL